MSTENHTTQTETEERNLAATILQGASVGIAAANFAYAVAKDKRKDDPPAKKPKG